MSGQAPTPAASTSTVPVSNVWIWLVVFAPSVSILLLPWMRFPPFPSAAQLDDPRAMLDWQLQMFLQPAVVIMIVLGWVGLIIAIVAAYKDWKLLTESGMQRPFHWAFVFLNLVIGPVYAIGRAVVVRQRTGRGLAVLWATIATFVATFVIAMIWATVLVVDMVTQITQTSGFGGS
jgi:hypothetical protein